MDTQGDRAGLRPSKDNCRKNEKGVATYDFAGPVATARLHSNLVQAYAQSLADSSKSRPFLEACRLTEIYE